VSRMKELLTDAMDTVEAALGINLPCTTDLDQARAERRAADLQTISAVNARHAIEEEADRLRGELAVQAQLLEQMRVERDLLADETADLRPRVKEYLAMIRQYSDRTEELRDEIAALKVRLARAELPA
jgi:hypothetical protein